MLSGSPHPSTTFASSQNRSANRWAFAIFQAQCGGKHVQTKPLKGFKGSGVLEMVEDFDGDTFRTVYTVRFADALYVLHAFQKKSKKGVATLQRDLDVIKSRLKMAERIHESWTSKKEGK